ncbi:unnamed protein product [Thelazia callipaeda]|uniref:non-specific serine/threonine protein kinase n=1 Tax=Thelazia callipaeda TaxID=103827 RepID=A0A3P7NKR3_THECL|nr:unnamed protein product [Thelazia callipaeda]
MCRRDLLRQFSKCFVLRTLHIATGQKHYKVRYCVERENGEKVMLIVTSLVNGTTLREAVQFILQNFLNELIKCAEFTNNHRILLYSSAFIFRYYLFVEYNTAVYDLEQILHVRRKRMKKYGDELISPVLSEKIIGHILRKILKALSYLHQYALHNNLVTRSVVVTTDGDIKLTGFKWTIMKNEDTRRALRLRENRFFGRPTQWAPEETLNNIEHYGPHTELWHVGLLIPEMITGEIFHLITTNCSEDVKQYAEQLVRFLLLKFKMPVPYTDWFPTAAKFAISSDIVRLWHSLMQPCYYERPTVEELLDRKVCDLIQSINKSTLKEVLLSDERNYRVISEESKEPIQKWNQLVNYSREHGASDITRLESLYLGMGRSEFFSSIKCSDSFDKNPIYRIDFRKVPNDLLLCVCVEVFKHRQRSAGLALTVHLDMTTADICTVVCRYVYKLVQKDIIGFVNYIRISLEVIQVLRRREGARIKYRCWQIHLDEDQINEKSEALAIVQVVFHGATAREILVNF